MPLPGDLPAPTTIVEQIVRAEELGFRSIWAPNVRGNDVLTVLALAGTRTTRIELGTSSCRPTRATPPPWRSRR